MKCVKCNMENPSDSGFCQYCGEKIVVSMPAEQNNNNALITVLTIIIMVLICLCFYFGSKYSEAKAQNDFFDKSAGIVIDDKTKYYHTYNCEVFQNTKKGYWIYNVEWAKDEGYKPCPKCH